jgi:hypothetical protein
MQDLDPDIAQKTSSRPDRKKPRRRWLKDARAVMTAVIAAVAATVVSVLLSRSSAPATNRVKITTPATPDSSTGRLLEVRGTARLAQGTELWLFVLARGLGSTSTTFYVQTTDSVTPDAAGRWRARAYIGSGGAANDGIRFIIIARISGAESSGPILTAVNRYGIGAPIARLPGKELAVSTVTVIRKN